MDSIKISHEEIINLDKGLRHISQAILNGNYEERLVCKSKNLSIKRLEQSVNSILELFQLNTNVRLIGVNSFIDDFINVFGLYANREFDTKLEISDQSTFLDAIASGINMLGEELESSTVSKNVLEVERNRLKESQQIAQLGDWEYRFEDKKWIHSEVFSEVLEVESKLLEDKFLESIGEKVQFAKFRNIEEVVEEAKKERVLTFESSFIDSNGRTKYLNNITSQILDANDKVIGIKGVIQDITALKEIQKQLSYQIELQKLITDVSASLIQASGDLERLINQILERISDFFRVDRSYFIAFEALSIKAMKVFEYNNPFVKYTTHKLFRETPELFDLCLQIVQTDEIVQFYNIENVPIKIERDSLRKSKVKSFLSLPVYGDDKGFAIFGMDCVRERRVWTEEEINAIKVITNIISDGLKRDFFERNLIAAREKAEESDRLKTAFLMNMSHEIRTPMNGIMGFLPFLQEPSLDDKTKDHYIEVVKESGNRLLNTINDIIEISRIEAGELDLNVSEVNVCNELEHISDFFRIEARQKGIKIIFKELPIAEQCVIRTDNSKLTSILNNLIKNALKFTNLGEIRLGVKRDKSQIKVFVEDTGIGIPLDRQEAIFERFVQGDYKLTRSYEGSGLGLAICKAYSEALNGSIQVFSELGKGSRFELTLPAPELKKKKQVDKTLLNDVLVAEDDPVSFEFLHAVLSKAGYRVHHAEDGDMALDLFLRETSIKMVFMDIKMPGMDGLEATREIRKRNKDIPIVVQTAHAFPGEREKAIEAGCSDYLIKPLMAHHVNGMLAKYLSKD